MIVPTRRTVHVTRTEHALPLPAPLLHVAHLVEIVRDELHRVDRPAADAEVRVSDGDLIASYETPRLSAVRR
ncbi:hypothetical protein MOV08_35295 [Streptomyces yunnanensis]|uniref:Uncharacterized protein n=1 Tax=Streptomyces yunnanensis TaxID=156453 RepID=A0ABY8AGC3_9ACTN|nr:hypothetical protein [Streptomyces yunnanensis]WEB44032.1 hypothetical protein MOV08_35295 [Streptomyces yunnanensis]